MSDVVKQIRTAMEGRIEALSGAFTKLDNKFDLEKNSFVNEIKRYGVIAGEGSNESGPLRFVTINRTFGVTLCNKFKGMLNKDEQQQDVGDILEDIMDDAIKDFMSSKLGLPTLVLNVVFSNNEQVEYGEIENLAILRFNVVVTFRQSITNC